MQLELVLFVFEPVPSLLFVVPVPIVFESEPYWLVGDKSASFPPPSAYQ